MSWLAAGRLLGSFDLAKNGRDRSRSAANLRQRKQPRKQLIKMPPKKAGKQKISLGEFLDSGGQSRPDSEGATAPSERICENAQVLQMLIAPCYAMLLCGQRDPRAGPTRWIRCRLPVSSSRCNRAFIHAKTTLSLQPESSPPTCSLPSSEVVQAPAWAAEGWATEGDSQASRTQYYMDDLPRC